MATRCSRVHRALIGFAILAAALVVSPLSAQAAPDRQSQTVPKTSAEVSAKLAVLAEANEKLSEQFNQAQIDVGQAQRDATEATEAAVKAQAVLRQAQRALATSISAQYKSASFSRTAALLASNSGQSYLETMQSLNVLAVHQSEIAKAASAATEASRVAEAKAARLASAAVAKRSELDKQRDTVQTEIDVQKKLFARLTAAEKARLLAAMAPAASPTQVASVRSIATGVSSSAGMASVTPPVNIAPASRGAATAVQAALSQRGKPYVWGAAGPESYDCSGLTMWAWAQAGVSLPHQSAQQQAIGTPVPQSQLQPGDLVFFGSPAYHVAMYIGNGMIVHAPTTGDVVKITPLAYMSDYSGATRVG